MKVSYFTQHFLCYFFKTWGGEIPVPPPSLGFLWTGFHCILLWQGVSNHFIAGAHPGGGKAFMSLCGIDCGPPRLPILPLTDESIKSLESDLRDIGFFEWSWAQLTRIQYIATLTHTLSLLFITRYWRVTMHITLLLLLYSCLSHYYHYTVEPLYSGHHWGMKFWPI